MKRDWLTLTFGVVLVGTVVGLSLRQNMPQRPAQPQYAPEPAPATGADVATPDGPARTEPPPSRAEPARSEKAAPPPRTGAASPNVETRPTSSESTAALMVQSDVPGASVFLDREFVGTTPLTLRDLATGQRQLNVTATGHEGYAAAIDIVPGANRVNVEFTKVRLNVTVPVVHRHAMGSCQGMLAATPKGISYETPNASDAFTLGYAELDEFEVDYLKKNLRMRRRAGKTWNFTSDNADALFVFHRDVSKARDKLAAAR
jgi:hypothetical protein